MSRPSLRRSNPRSTTLGTTTLTLLIALNLANQPAILAAPDMKTELPKHLVSIAKLAQHSPMVTVPEGAFLMGSIRTDNDPYGLGTQYDDTELPQRRIWLDSYQIDRDEVSLGEYLAHLSQHNHHPSEELQRLIWHLITIHSMPDAVMASWPALYLTWAEASDFCKAQGKRLPGEAEWEKAARGTNGSLFPWGQSPPELGMAVFGQYHVHEIPLVAAVNGGEEGRSPYGLHHMAGNVAEWVQDWYGFDYYGIMPERNPPGPNSGRYKIVRGGSWKSNPMMLRAATRGGSAPDQRAATIGFRCAKAAS